MEFAWALKMDGLAPPLFTQGSMRVVEGLGCQSKVVLVVGVLLKLVCFYRWAGASKRDGLAPPFLCAGVDANRGKHKIRASTCLFIVRYHLS